MNQSGCLGEIIQELVSQAFAFVRSGYKACHIQDPDGYIADPVLAFGILWSAGDMELPARALGSDERDALVGLDCGEWIISDFHFRESEGFEEG